MIVLAEDDIKEIIAQKLAHNFADVEIIKLNVGEIVAYIKGRDWTEFTEDG